MSEERKRILDMLAEGKISAEEADELLRTLEESGVKPTASHRQAKFLRIRVTEKSGDKAKVNVNIPLSLAKFAMKFIPQEAKTTMADQNINLDEIIREIQDSPTAGKIVEVDDENDHVEIYLE